MPIQELTLVHGDVSARVAPARGAIVTALSVAGRELLYMERASLEDPARSVRGGIPILFPFAGRLDGDTLVHAGTSMKQHGFGRNKPWTVAEQRADRLRLSLHDDDQTRAVYPHAFHAEQTFSLLPRGLSIELAMHNLGKTPMPVAPGWHPYFPCASADKPRVVAHGTHIDSARFSPDAEFDFGVTMPASGHVPCDIPGLGRLKLSFSWELRFFQCWSLPRRDFICLEPFTGPNNAINTDARISIPGAAKQTVWMRIELD